MRFLLLISAALSVRSELALTTQSAWYIDPSVGPISSLVAMAPSPVTLALRDLKLDWYKVIGTSPALSKTAAPAEWDGDAIVVFKIDASLAPESFTLVASSAGAAPTLTVAGGDTRGLIYGIYHLSADFLGVDPFWWWNNDFLTFEEAGIAVDAAYSYASGAPTFLSRGGFNNDEGELFHAFTSTGECRLAARAPPPADHPPSETVGQAAAAAAAAGQRPRGASLGRTLTGRIGRVAGSPYPPSAPPPLPRRSLWLFRRLSSGRCCLWHGMGRPLL